MIWEYCNLTCFQTRDLKVQKWMFLLYEHGEFIYYLILLVFFFIIVNSLENPCSENCITLLCNYFWHKKRGIFFSFIFNAVFCKVIIFMGYWWAIKTLIKYILQEAEEGEPSVEQTKPQVKEEAPEPKKVSQLWQV